MKGENFIRVIDDAMTHEQCAKLIDGFHAVHDHGGSYTRQKDERAPKSAKDDTAISAQELLLNNLFKHLQEQMLNMLKKHITAYVEDYETGIFAVDIGEQFPMSQTGIKIQMTRPSEGYHVWHCENASIMNKGRFLTWILYLNDVDEGGETELIHLSERISPKTGRLVIFPAGWTHTHRGNPPLSNTKYIATGWMEYTI